MKTMQYVLLVLMFFIFLAVGKYCVALDVTVNKVDNEYVDIITITKTVKKSSLAEYNKRLNSAKDSKTVCVMYWDAVINDYTSVIDKIKGAGIEDK